MDACDNIWKVYVSLCESLHDAPSWENMQSVNSAQQSFLLAMTFLGETGNGGLCGYLGMFGGGTVARTIDALREIGAEEAASLLASTIERLCGGGLPPSDWDERQHFLDGLPESAVEDLERRLSDHVYVSLEPRLREYFDRNRAEICAGLKSS